MMARLTFLTALICLAACGDTKPASSEKKSPQKSIEMIATSSEKPAQKQMAAAKTTPDPQEPSIENGAKFYKKCAACHLPNGVGVKGAFPPLTDNYISLAKTEQGRAYLVAVIINGVQGELIIDGTTYRGAMIAQGRSKSDQTIADTLNYISTKFHPNSELKEFSAAEVSDIRTAQGRLSGKQVRLLRPE